LAGTGFSKVRLDSLSDGMSPLIAAVGLRLVLINAASEPGEHHRQMSVIPADGLVAAAIALNFVNPRLALWAP
jgi:hypothetical protein